MNDWILTDEKLPEDNTDVLVTLASGKVTVLRKIYTDDSNGEPCYQFQDYDGDAFEVIAWMPLPKPYIVNDTQKEKIFPMKE